MESLYTRLESCVGLEEIRMEIEHMGRLPIVEIYDARESYIEKFRQKLIDQYELTSSLLSMSASLETTCCQ